MAISYKADFAGWAAEQAKLLRSGSAKGIDFENLAEEIESMGRSEHRELKSRMMVLIQHLLKWRFQAAYRSESWRRTIVEQRAQIPLVLEDSPSLRNSLADGDWIRTVWSSAVKSAAGETGLPPNTFPDTAFWSMDDILADDFWPE